MLFRNYEKIRKIYKMSGEISKNFENIKRNFEENFEKTKNTFLRNFLDKKFIKSKLIRDSLFAPNRASLSCLLSLVHIRVTARTIREETILVKASSGRLPIYTQKW